MDNKKYVVYKRVSTAKQGKEGLGIKAQQNIIDHYIDSSLIAAEFTEVATAKYMTAKERPELNKAIDLCKEKGYILVTAKVDRLSRITKHALEIFDRLEGNLMCLDVPNMDKFTLTIFCSIAERELELISLRTRIALEEKRRRLGEWRKGTLTPEKRRKGANRMKQLSKDNSRNKQATALILQLRNNTNMSYKAIANYLNDNGYKTVKDKQFYDSTVRRLFKRSCEAL